MFGVTRVLSWVVTILFVVAFIGGMRIHAEGPGVVDTHVSLGLATTLLLLLCHCWPLFYLLGIVNSFLGALRAEGGHESAVLRARRLRSSILWPSLITIVFGVVAPVLALAQMRQMVPQFVHGPTQAVAGFMHVVAWRRYMQFIELITALIHSPDSDVSSPDGG